MGALETRPLGNSGLSVSVAGLGCNNFGRRIGREETQAVVDAALDAGINFFDTADIYGDGESEELLGEVLGGRRDDVLVATKFGMGGDGPLGSRDYIMQAVQRSLKRLGTDRIDYYWYHRPDGQTPIAETLAALNELIEAGKVRAIGASNFSADQVEEADRVAREQGLTGFSAVQNEYSLLVRDAEHDVLPVGERLGWGFVPYFPLASGLLTGKYRRGAEPPEGTRLSGRGQIASERQFELIESLEHYARERGIEITDVAIGALLAKQPVSSVIAGATKPEQVRSNARAASWTPNAEDLQALDALLGPG